MAIIKQGATFTIGGDRPVRRMGFGAMQLTGPGVWGPPVDRANAFSVLRRAIELGANFIDTADVYGPGDNERLIRAALTPYPSDLVIATKAGLVRTGPATQEAHGTSMNGAEAHIRQAAQSSLRDLGLQSIDLYQLHRVDPATPIEETLRAFRALQEAGQIRHIGLSEVGLEDLERARRVVPIATVQNVYNLENRKHEAVLAYCEHHGIGFIPFWPQHIEGLRHSKGLARIAQETQATARQVALAWLLKKSSVTILIPGTSSPSHLEENMAACDLDLSKPQMAMLNSLALQPEA